MPTLELNGKLFAEQSGTGPVKLKIDELTESTANAGIRLAHPLKSSAGDDIITADGALHNINFDNVANNAIHVNKLNIPNDTISGDKVHGGTISGSILHTDVNINNALASATFPIGHLIKTTYYPIIRGTYTNTNFPMDDTVPQITEGVQIFSQAYTPSSAASNILIRAYLVVGETSNVGDTGLVGLFIDSQTDVLRMGWSAASGVADHMTTSTPIYIEHLMNSWTGSRTLSLRMGGHMHAVNYYPADNYNWPTTYFGIASRTSFIVQEFS